MGQWVIGNIGRSRCDLFSFSFPTGEGIKVDPLPKFSQSPKKERTTQQNTTQTNTEHKLFCCCCKRRVEIYKAFQPVEVGLVAFYKSKT